jgi:hypothetical protein
MFFFTIFVEIGSAQAVHDGNLLLKGIALMREITKYELQYIEISGAGNEKITKEEKFAIRNELHSRCRRIGISDSVPDQLLVLMGPDIVEALMFSIEDTDPHVVSHQLTTTMEILNEICTFINPPYKYQIQKLKERILIFRNGWKKKVEKKNSDMRKSHKDIGF